MQAVQAEIGLWVQSPVRDHPGDDSKIKAVVRQVELEEALGLIGGDRHWLRLRIVGPPDRIEAGPSPAAHQERERA